MSKSRDAFRTISEVSEALDTPAHVLRFWESKFTQVKPVKRAGGRRYYRPADLNLLAGIKKLLHDDGLTIKGAQKLLREEGVRKIAKVGEALLDAQAAQDGAIEGTSAPVLPPAPATDQTTAAAPAVPAGQDLDISNVVALPKVEARGPALSLNLSLAEEKTGARGAGEEAETDAEAVSQPAPPAPPEAEAQTPPAKSEAAQPAEDDESPTTPPRPDETDALPPHADAPALPPTAPAKAAAEVTETPNAPTHTSAASTEPAPTPAVDPDAPIDSTSTPPAADPASAEATPTPPEAAPTPDETTPAPAPPISVRDDPSDTDSKAPARLFHLLQKTPPETLMRRAGEIAPLLERMQTLRDRVPTQ
ncbi:MerR family transcriptional regulator [Thalassorhabdomicrobium marinisediminis]|uniref:MerR family transcriptional regulator n=1 Tax=Thalassorhabdomicrobium marinisediminis TaxID=2170577 RepID=UPI002492EA9F|nr:MerR family transcriptional regulator [Thalassorhabdomicrobium marinisediminis]